MTKVKYVVGTFGLGFLLKLLRDAFKKKIAQKET